MTAPALAVQVNGLLQVSGDNYNTYTQSCNSMAQIRAFIGVSGVQVFVRGFSAPNDGGQGNFYWNSSGTGPDDNGVTNVVPSGSTIGCWTRISSTAIGNGTVTNVSGISANGVSFSITNPTTIPAITISLGAITPSSVAATGTITGSNISGTNTGDQTITLTGQVTGSGTGSFATTIANNTVTSAQFRQSAALSVVGNSTNATANVADITAPALSVLGTNQLGTSLSFTTTPTIKSLAIFGDANISTPGIEIVSPGFTQASKSYISLAIDGAAINAGTLFQSWGCLVAMPTIISGSTTSQYGIQITSPIAIGGTTALSAGINVQDMGTSASVTTSYGIRIDAQTLSTTAWSLFCADGFFVRNNGNVSVGTAALGTTATAGFFWLTTSAGAPTGAATAPYSLAAALHYDSTNNFLYIRCNGTWRKSTVYA